MSRIRTVTGDMNVSEFSGMILNHEHLWIDLRNQAANGALERPVVEADYPQLMRDPYSMRDNLLVGEMSLAKEECGELLRYGCQMIVDCSTSQIGRAPEQLRSLSLATGMKIVMGCGYYTGDTYSTSVADIPVEQLAEEMLQECKEGIHGIRPGVLGEFGTSKDILPNERRALEAAAIVQKKTNLGIQIHIYPWSTNGEEAADILLQRGVEPGKIVICHSDVEPNQNYIELLLKRGVYVEFDNFGKEFTPAPDASFASGRFCSDEERTKLFAELYKAGWGRQLLMTNDICLKCMLKHFGGKGYSHVFEKIPYLMERQGLFPADWQEQIMSINPQNFLKIE